MAVRPLLDCGASHTPISPAAVKRFDAKLLTPQRPSSLRVRMQLRASGRKFCHDLKVNHCPAGRSPGLIELKGHSSTQFLDSTDSVYLVNPRMILKISRGFKLTEPTVEESNTIPTVN